MSNNVEFLNVAHLRSSQIKVVFIHNVMVVIIKIISIW